MRQLLFVLRDSPELVLLTLVVAVGFVYLVALALWTPANSWDAMWYHLARPAFWKQQHAVAYIAQANDLRLNANPPVAEIGSLYTIVVAQSDRFVTLVSLSSYVVMTLAVLGIARRLGLDQRRALLGALAFATLPVIVLQASGALNDLVVAAFLCICVYFLLGSCRSDVALASLALGTKFTALIAMPILAVIALVTRRTRLRTLALAGSVAVVTGSGWSAVNLVETGALDGRLADQSHSVASLGITSIAATTRLLTDFVEVPGAGGWWAASYLAVAAVMAGFADWGSRGCLNTVRRIGVFSLIALSPLAIIVLAPKTKKGYQWLWFHVGRGDLGVIDQDRGVVGASALASFFGPLGLLLLLSGAGVALAVLSRRTNVPGLNALFLSAPLLFALTLAATVVYDPYHGRFFIFPMALAAAAAAAFLTKGPISWGVVAVAATTLLLTLRANDEKPPTLWGAQRWRVQTQVAGTHNGQKAMIRFAEESVPAHAQIGLTLRSVDWSYPFFGRNLRRTVRFVPHPGTVRGDLQWLVEAPGNGAPGPSWRVMLRTADGWRLFKRVRRS